MEGETNNEENDRGDSVTATAAAANVSPSSKPFKKKAVRYSNIKSMRFKVVYIRISVLLT